MTPKQARAILYRSLMAMPSQEEQKQFMISLIEQFGRDQVALMLQEEIKQATDVLEETA